MLPDVILQIQSSDRWRWCLDFNGVYSVRYVYHLLTTDDSQELDTTSKFIWHRQVPLKVSLLVWRLLCNRLPTKSNLVARGIIFKEAQMCVSGCNEVETAHHLFMPCATFSELWRYVRDWLGVYGVNPIDISDHFQ